MNLAGLMKNLETFDVWCGSNDDFRRTLGHSHLLALLLLCDAVFLQPDRLHGNEARRVVLAEAANLVHGALALVVQMRRLGAAAQDEKTALVGTAAHLAVDFFLAGGDGLVQVFALGREVEAVVQAFGPVEGDELVAQGADFAVEHEPFEVHVGGAEDGEAGRLVAAAGFDADEAVLDDVDAADAVAAGEGVGGEEEFHRVGCYGGFAVGIEDEFDGDAFFKNDGEVFGDVGTRGWCRGELPHVVWWG